MLIKKLKIKNLLNSELLILSCLKKAEDRNSFIIRVFNPTEFPVEGKIRLPVTVKKAWYTNLNERTVDLLMMKGNEISICVEANKIVTIGIEA